MRLVLGYVRVSSIEQEQGFGPEPQAERIKAYAASKELGQPELHFESKSGESIIHRLELHTVLARAEAVMEEGGEAHVIVPGLDRLTRDLIDQESIVLRCQQTGVRLHSTLEAENDTLDPAYAADPMRRAIRQFFGIIHQLDRAIIQRRLDGGLARKAAAGGFTGGRIPFGYRSVDQELVVHPEEAAVVRQLFALRARGIDLGTIAGVLANQYPQLCLGWTKQTVSRALARKPLYLQGVFKPRGSDLEVQRPDLVILDPGDVPEPVDVTFDWSKVPKTMRLCSLAVLLKTSEKALQALISENGLLVTYKGSSPQVPQRTAERLHKLVRDRGQK